MTEVGVIDEYFSLTKKYISIYGEKTILLYQVGSFFEIYGEKNEETGNIEKSKITYVCEMVGLTISPKNANSSIHMAGIHIDKYDKWLKKMIDLNYTVVIYEQQMQPIQNSIKKKIIRCLKGIYSIGTYFSTEDTIITTKLSNNICCIWLELTEYAIFIGTALINIFTGDVYITQNKIDITDISKNDATVFDELYTFLSVYNPAEIICILPSKNGIYSKFLQDYITSFKNIHFIFLENNKNNKNNTDFIETDNYMKIKAQQCEKQTIQRTILQEIYGESYINYMWNEYIENETSTQAFIFLCEYIKTHNPSLIKKIKQPDFKNYTNRLILANHSLIQLNIIDDGNNENNFSSVSKLCSHFALTSMGKRSIIHMITTPTHNIKWLQNEYDLTEEFITINKNPIVYETIKSSLMCIKDLSKIQRQLLQKKNTLQGFMQLYNSLINIDIIHKLLIDINIKTISINGLENITIICNKISNALLLTDNLIQIEDNKYSKGLFSLTSRIIFEECYFRPGYSIELDNIIINIFICNNKLEAIRQYLNKLIGSESKNISNPSVDYIHINEPEKSPISFISTEPRCKLLTDILKQNKKDNIELLFLQNKEQIIPDTFNFSLKYNDFIFKKQGKDTTIIHSQITELCDNIFNLKGQLKEKINELFKHFLIEMEKTFDLMEPIITFIIRIDTLFAKMSIAQLYQYCKPLLDNTNINNIDTNINNTDTNINNTDNNHSYIEATNLRHALIERIQTDEIYVANSITLNNTGMLLFGTNMVGKTSLIRALGIATVMAQAGFYVPCSQFKYKPYTAIYTRILGNDNFFKGLSTFATEMTELRTILKYSNSHSLILGDELCSGTETSSAISIFLAGIRWLNKCQSSYIFATHLHEVIHSKELKPLLETGQLFFNHLHVWFDYKLDAMVYDRTLKSGAGDPTYGLEVCKALHLPTDFLNDAYRIRQENAVLIGNETNINNFNTNSCSGR